jgi:hypothetical protein
MEEELTIAIEDIRQYGDYTELQGLLREGQLDDDDKSFIVEAACQFSYDEDLIVLLIETIKPYDKRLAREIQEDYL